MCCIILLVLIVFQEYCMHEHDEAGPRENAGSKMMRKTIARHVIEPRYKLRRVCLYNTSQMIIWLQC